MNLSYVTGYAKTFHIHKHNGKKYFLSSVDNQLVITTRLPNVNWSAFSKACFWGLSGIHKCSSAQWIPLVALYWHPPYKN